MYFTTAFPSRHARAKTRASTPLSSSELAKAVDAKQGLSTHDRGKRGHDGGISGKSLPSIAMTALKALSKDEEFGR